MKELIILCGKSASGKDTILKELAYTHEPCVSCTTRPMRLNESEGRDYYFISEDRFQEMLMGGCFLETRTYYTIENCENAIWHYGLNKSEILESDYDKFVTILDVKGIKEFLTNIKDNDLNIKTFIVYVSCNDELRKERAIKRAGYEEAEFMRRMADDELEFSRVGDVADIIIENETITPSEASDYILHSIKLIKSYIPKELE